MSKVAIVGSGFVGRAWAISFARAGHEVALWDGDRSAPAKRADLYRGRAARPRGQRSRWAARRAADVARAHEPVADLGEALAGAIHVQENTPEDVAVKREIFGRLDALAGPDAVLASSTSAILPSPFTEILRGRARCLVVSSHQSALSDPGRGSRARAMDGRRAWSSEPPRSFAPPATRRSS